MSDIKAGMIMKMEFCRSSHAKFTGYINYMDRPEAIRTEMIAEYDIYNDYMGNPEKTSGLFTESKDKLKADEIMELKNAFKRAQENGSIMWQPIISFDNRWLAEQGLYDMENKILDEKKIHEICRKGLRKVLEAEGLENAIWSASIHYNTDNIHIHMGVVETNPQRKQKMFNQYEYIEDLEGEWFLNGGGEYQKIDRYIEKKFKEHGLRLIKYRREPLLDEKGNVVQKEEIVGRIQMKHIEAAKSAMMSEILQQRDCNITINNLIRESIVKQKKQHSLIRDKELVGAFEKLYEKMPDVKRSLWNYNNNTLAGIREDIDTLSRLYMEKYHADELTTLEELLNKQQEMYAKAYGGNRRNYKDTKIEELYSRMGNAILKEIKEYDKKVRAGENVEIVDFVDNVLRTEDIVEDVDIDVKSKSNRFVIRESGDFKRGMILLEEAGREKDEELYESAIDWLEYEWNHGNVLAGYELGKIYQEENGYPNNPAKAEAYFKETLKGIEEIIQISDNAEENTLVAESLKENILMERSNTIKAGHNEEKNRNWYADKIGTGGYAIEWSKKYKLAKQLIHRAGRTQDERLYMQAKALFEGEWQRGNILAGYELGKIYEKGKGEAINIEKGQAYFQKCLKGFQEVLRYADMGEEEGRTQFIKGYVNYRIGKQYANGEGVEKTPEEAYKYYLEASGYDCIYADFALGGMYYYGSGVEQNYEKAMEHYKVSQELPFSDYQLGEMYRKGQWVEQNNTEAEKYYRMAYSKFVSEEEKEPNEIYEYKLGVMLYEGYGVEKNEEEAIKYLEMAAESKYVNAQYKLANIYLEIGGDEYLQRAVDLLTEAAEEGKSNLAQYALGKIYLDKDNNFYNIEKGVKYLEQSAEQDNEYAKYTLGKVYLDAEMGYYDAQNGLSLLKEVADKGNEYAQYALGKELTNPEREYYDIEVGEKYLKLSAEQGNQYAQYQLGKLYLRKNTLFYNVEDGIKYLQMSAEQENEYARFTLGGLYYYGSEVELNYKMAMEYYLESEELPFSDYQLGEMFRKGQGVELNKAEADKYYSMAYSKFMDEEEKEPNKIYEYKLGVMLYEGYGVEKNEEEAIKYLEMSAESKYVNAQYKLANIYLEIGEEEYLQRAVDLLTEAAEEGKNDLAQYALGKVYLDEDSNLYNIEKGVKYLEMSAEQDNEYAKYTLGKVYLDTEMGHYDVEKGLRYLKEVADKGNEYAQYTLGKELTNPEQEYYDIETGEKYLKLSAEQGNSQAQYQLGKMYLKLNNPCYNVQEGIKYLEMSAEQENEYAKLALGMEYMYGINIPEDYEKAKEYFESAAEQGNEYAGNMLDVLRNRSMRRVNSQMNQNMRKIWGGSKVMVELDLTIRKLKAALNNEMESYRNQIIYEQMLREKGLDMQR